jgi:hypothetical protein
MTAVYRVGLWLLLCGLLLLSALSVAAADRAGLIDVPRVTGIVIDGAADDWGDRGFQVNSPRPLQGRSHLEPGFWPRYRVGWDEHGLLLCFQVQVSTDSETDCGGRPDVGPPVGVVTAN